MIDKPTKTSKVVSEEKIQLLAERFRVKRSKKKVGEVIIRKEIVTEIVEVPIRREKLIIEKVGTPSQPLGEIDLGDSHLENFYTEESIESHFSSWQQAIAALTQIQCQSPQEDVSIRIEVASQNPEILSKTKEIFQRQTKEKT